MKFCSDFLPAPLARQVFAPYEFLYSTGPKIGLQDFGLVAQALEQGLHLLLQGGATGQGRRRKHGRRHGQAEYDQYKGN